MPFELTSALLLVALACACAVSLFGRTTPAASSPRAAAMHADRVVLEAYGVVRAARQEHVDLYA